MNKVSQTSYKSSLFLRALLARPAQKARTDAISMYANNWSMDWPSNLPIHPGVSHMFCFGDPNSTVSTGRRPGWIWPGWIWGWRERSVWPKFQTKILTKLMRGQFGQNFSFFQGILPKVEEGLGESDQVESVKGFFSLVIDSSLFMYVQLWAKCLSFSNLFQVEIFKVLSFDSPHIALIQLVQLDSHIIMLHKGARAYKLEIFQF